MSQAHEKKSLLHGMEDEVEVRVKSPLNTSSNRDDINESVDNFLHPLNIEPDSTIPYLSKFQLFALSGFQMGFSSLWLVLLVISIPHQVLMIVGEESKASNLGKNGLIGDECTMVKILITNIF